MSDNIKAPSLCSKLCLKDSGGEGLNNWVLSLEEERGETKQDNLYNLAICGEISLEPYTSFLSHCPDPAQAATSSVASQLISWPLASPPPLSLHTSLESD